MWMMLYRAVETRGKVAELGERDGLDEDQVGFAAHHLAHLRISRGDDDSGMLEALIFPDLFEELVA